MNYPEMDEWVLTDEELFDIVMECRDDRNGGHVPQIVIIRATATAALKKCIKYMEKHNDGAAFWGLGGFVEEGDVLITSLNWVSLKAALEVGDGRNTTDTRRDGRRNQCGMG